MKTQLVLPSAAKLSRIHGGDLGVGKRKTARPVATKRPMHVVLRSSLARGNWSLLRHAEFVKRAAAFVGRKNRVKVIQLANSGNHLHLLLQAQTREGFQTFLRVFAGQVAQHITRARKGNAFGRRFWDLLAFSRIVEWGKDFARVRMYLAVNSLEADGLLPPRNERASPLCSVMR